MTNPQDDQQPDPHFLEVAQRFHERAAGIAVEDEPAAEYEYTADAEGS